MGNTVAEGDTRKRVAVDAPRGNVFYMDPDDLTIIGLDTDDDKRHPLYDERIKLPVNTALMDSMRAIGFFGSIVCRKNGSEIEVEAGRQRVRAARELNKQLAKEGKEPIRVTVQIRKDKDEVAYELGIAENEFRVNDDALTKANKIKDYLDRVGDSPASRKELGRLFGMTAQQIGQYMKLHDLGPKILKAIAEGKISATAASEFSDLSRKDQEEALEKALASGNTSRAAIRTQKKSKRKTKDSGGGEGDGGEVLAAPSKRLITKILKANRDHGDILNGDVIKGILWVLGELPSARIANMAKLEREAKGE